MTQREDQKSAISTAPHSLDSKIEFVQCDSRPSEDFTFVGASLFSAPGQVAYATVGTETWIILNTDADTDGESLIGRRHAARGRILVQPLTPQPESADSFETRRQRHDPR